MKYLSTIILLVAGLFGVNSVFGQNIDQMEYYLDTDPGFDSGTDIPIVVGPTVNASITIPTGALSLGFHTLVVRARQGADWSIVETRPFFVSATTLATDEDLVAMEYFLDTDPGFGLGTPIPIPVAQTVNPSLNIPTGALSPGFHTLFVRTQDQNGDWSITETRPFFVANTNLSVEENITDLEYFIDTDPGYGLGTAITITTGTPINVSELIPTGALTAGFHTLFIRARDENNNWGLPESRTFFVDNIGNVLLTNIEHFIDTDPGFGNGTIEPIAPPAATIDQPLTIPTSALPTGNYELGLRLQGDAGGWSLTDIIPFTVCDAPTADFASDVVCEGAVTTFTDNSASIIGDTYRWDFDSDGVVDDTTFGNTTFTYPAGGTYIASLVVDRAGCPDSIALTVDVGILPIADAGLDQNICGDNTTLAADALQAGETGLWSIISGSGIFGIDNDPASTIMGLTPGINEFQWDVTDPTGTCTTSDIVQIEYLVVSVSVAGPDQNVCADNSVLAATAEQLGETATWTVVSGSGTFLDALDPSSTVTGLAPGINEFQWEVTDGTGTCTTTDIVQLDYIIPSMSDAGIDQSICTSNTTMAATPPQVGETGAWTIISGTGLITTASDPQTTITGITTSTLDLQWTITDGTGTCSTSDQISLVVNLPITASDASGTVSIGDTLFVDVQNLATVNAGDVLTTTITTSPTKGTATVLADGRIQFVPNTGILGADNIDFQLCNQCNNCDTGAITIDIPNNAPVIAPDTVSIAAGTTTVSVSLAPLVSDINNNADLTTLRVTVQPTSGAVATIDASFNLVIDYTGITFSGIDQVSIEVCDDQGVCAVSVLSFQVTVSAEADPDIIVYNAVTPNQDNKHDFLKIDFITAYPGNEVFIYDKIGNLVFKIVDYDNISNVFKGVANEGETRLLPEGTYYYVIILNDERTEKGFLLLQN